MEFLVEWARGEKRRQVRQAARMHSADRAHNVVAVMCCNEVFVRSDNQTDTHPSY